MVVVGEESAESDADVDVLSLWRWNVSYWFWKERESFALLSSIEMPSLERPFTMAISDIVNTD